MTPISDSFEIQHEKEIDTKTSAICVFELKAIFLKKFHVNVMKINLSLQIWSVANGKSVFSYTKNK